MIDFEKLNVHFKFLDKASETLAMVTIDDGTISLRGFRIMKSKYANRKGQFIRLVPPTFGAKHSFTIFFIDKENWHKLENKVFEEYDTQTIEDSLHKFHT